MRGKLALHRMGVPIELQPRVYDARERAIIESVQPYTMTSQERIVAMCDAVSYLSRNRIEGAIVECGVWRGGSMMAAALALLAEGEPDRELHLYDTFEGMTEPGPHDISFRGWTGAGALSYLGADIATASLEEVKQNMVKTGYPMDLCRFVVGPVEQTLPITKPAKIALLRLDTDWYESTKLELEHLVPLLVPGGVLVIDDYGAWEGARRAVDDYFASLAFAPLLNRIDFTGRVCVMPERLSQPSV